MAEEKSLNFLEGIIESDLKNGKYKSPELAKSRTGEHFQFLRMGYFCLDPNATPNKLIFNRRVTLRDTWTKGAGSNGWQ